MKKILTVLAFQCLILASLFSKNFTLSGTLRDKDTNEPLIGANILVGTSGALTDYDGSFTLSLPEGEYNVKFSYVGFITAEQTISLDKDLQVAIYLSPIVMNEVVITADIAKERETPVAFSNISTLKLKEELASQDLPMILNSTPGAYATRSGGGEGDARINIRGFNQRNVAVMLDGVPVNDMENGQVYWSNWAGLDNVTQTMQVQRGLGASKLSIPSVGGTINILTKGIDSKRSIDYQQEIGNNNMSRFALSVTTGRMKGNWAVSAMGSFKQTDGWVDGTYSKAFFYYLRIDKQIGKHLISLSGLGAPQTHGQRAFTGAIGTFDSGIAKELGVTNTQLESSSYGVLGINRGTKYNQFWGYRDGKVFNTAENYFHKPQYSFRHSWQPNNQFFWSNVAYLSIAQGGGTSLGGDGIDAGFYDKDGQLKIDSMVKYNVNKAFGKEAFESRRFIRSSVNNHFWYGLLSTVKYDVNKNLSLSGGLDGRIYKGDHWREVRDLLGGNFGYDNTNGNANVISSKNKLVVGSKYEFNYRGYVNWAGVFGLAEYKKNDWTGFLNVSGAMVGYKMDDYFKPKVVTLNDSVSFQVTASAPKTYDGITYTINSPEAKIQSIGWINIPSFTIKSGASYNIDDHHSVFGNIGLLSRPPRFANVIYINRNGRTAALAANYDNEKIAAVELGYSYKSKIFSANLNTYYTDWRNKPLETLYRTSDGDAVPYNIPGINALHKGIELDFAYRVTRNLTFEGLASIGDWRWNSAAKGSIVINGVSNGFEFDARGVHVGDAAQTQFGASIRYEPVKRLYIKIKGTYFDRNYANFNPEGLNNANAGRDSWRMPAYSMFDFHSGYNFKMWRTLFEMRLNVLNVLDGRYIADGVNNAQNTFGITSANYDAASAAVFFGLGRQWSLSLRVSF